jgi:predicted TIM-barrel fold metal-dependent hydrolase
MIVDCEARIWDLREVDFEDPEIAVFWKSMMEHGRILTRELEELHRLVRPSDLVAMMDRQGIDHACLTSFAFPTVMGEDFQPGDLVLEAVREYPDRITGYVSLSPQRPGALDELRRWAERGIRSVSIYPPEGFYPDDREICYPFYERCLELGVDTIFIHVGLQSQPQLELKYAHPLGLDAAARDFPDIRFVAEHFAYPWEADLIAVAWKHKNVHICCTYIAAMAPWAPGPLWHAVGRAARDLGTLDQIVWGSDWAFWTERSVSEQIAALRSLQIPERLRAEWGYPELTDADREAMLGGNAARLFGLERTGSKAAPVPAG